MIFVFSKSKIRPPGQKLRRDKNWKISKEKLVHGAILRSSGLLKHERESPGTHFHSAKSNGEPSRPLWQNFISTRFRRFRVRKWIFQKKIVLEKFYKSKKVNRLKSRGMRCVLSCKRTDLNHSRSPRSIWRWPVNFLSFFTQIRPKSHTFALLQKKFKKICFKNNLSKWAPSKQPSYIIPSMFTNNLIQVGPLQCPLNPIFPRGIFAISHAFAFRSQTTQLKCVPSGPKPW